MTLRVGKASEGQKKGCVPGGIGPGTRAERDGPSSPCCAQGGTDKGKGSAPLAGSSPPPREGGGKGNKDRP